MHSLQFGIDILLQQPPSWQYSRIALVTNHAAATNRFQPARLALLQAGFNIVKLFSPEHGLDATGADGHLMHDGIDALTGLPVISLYGDKLAPAREDLKGIDTVLFDIPDTGCRFYTYLWTMTHVMEACAAYNIPFVIADRPNPQSGNLNLAEGPLLDETRCSSFIGRWQIPVKHNCTLGELARYFNSTREIGCHLKVIACVNWSRNILYPQWGHLFVPLSPAIPGFESALLYPGLCFLEATNISEGRGTATPFRVAGAPWMQARETAELFNSATPAVAGEIYARPVHFTPCEGKYRGEKCQGVMLHVGSLHHFKAVAAGWLLLRIIKELHPQWFSWAGYKTHVNPTGRRHLDLLSGMADAQQVFELPVKQFAQDLKKYLSPVNWEQQVHPYLIYQ